MWIAIGLVSALSLGVALGAIGMGVLCTISDLEERRREIHE